MKRKELLRHIKTQGCRLLREGKRHSVYWNQLKGKTSTVPRHNEVDDFLARKICRDLDILEP
ncbi:MAG: type II toxin-antitoxin system HicA family toxin [Elusimicrobia bacterium]|nr:type II toxin-antitoxin system HicA family toxin [Elusimicrobiota bacterium]